MSKFFLFSAIVCLAVFASCQNDGNKASGVDAPKSTILSGSIKVLVDESLEPIIQDQLAVFHYSYKTAKIELIVRPENQVVNLLLQDSAEVAVLTRELKPEELKFYEARGFKPRVYQFAVDAVTLIVNKNDSDSTITLNAISDLMRGEGNKTLVFDNANSGTVRYLKDLVGVDTLPQNRVYAVQSNPEVIQYVSEHPGTIGVLGLNWILRPDSSSLTHLKQIRVLRVQGLKDQVHEDAYYDPSQSNLALNLYPLARPVYILNAEPRYGLGMGFSAFLTGDRGQRIILKSGLMPDSLPPREIIIRKK